MDNKKVMQQALEALKGLFGTPENWESGGVAVWRLGGSGAPRKAITALEAALEQPVQEPLVRYCPDCGTIGPVPTTARDCCPDGQHARMVPENFAKSCRETFMRSIAKALPVQEPVAIALNTGTKQGVKWLKNVEHGESLYTTQPAAQRPWQGLTPEEMKHLYPYGRSVWGKETYEAIEKALKERNHG